MAQIYEYKDQVVRHRTLVQTRCDRCNEVIDTHRYESHWNFTGTIAHPFPEDYRNVNFQLCNGCTELLLNTQLIEYEDY